MGVCIINAQENSTLYYLKQATDFNTQKKYDSAIFYAKKCMLKNKGHKELEIKALIEQFYASSKTNPEAAQKIFKEAELKAIQIKNWKLLAATYYKKGKTAYDNREMGKAQPFYLRVDSLSEKYNFVNNITIKAILDRSEISRITFTHEGVEKAAQLQKDALKLSKKIKSQELIHDVYLRMADMNGLMDNLPDAKKYTDSAFAYYKNADSPSKLTRVYQTYMNYYYAINDNERARETIENSISYLEKKEEPLLLARMTTTYGNFFRKKVKDCNNAVTQFEKSKEIYRSQNDTLNDGYLYLLEGLALCNASINNYREGYNYYQATYETKKAIIKKDNNDLTRKLETKYQTEKKEQEIALLTFQNTLAKEQKANQRNLFIAAISLTTLAALFFFFQYRNRQKTNKKLRELDAAKSTFFTNISHDFRTPLTLIKGPIEDQLEDTTLTLGKRKNLNAAYKNTERLENLVDQLMSLAKLNSSAMPLQVQPVDLINFLQTYTEGFQYQSEEQGLDFSLSTTIDPTNAWLDRDILEKILYNLLGNALKYTSKNGKIIVNGITKNDVFELSVYNSAAALSEEEKQQLFHRFYQTDSKNEGAGIGLSLIKQLTKLHKGNISVENKEEGITFSVSIPTLKTTYEDHEILSEELHTTNIASEKLQEKDTQLIEISNDAPVLLVVDDTKDIRNYVESIFQDNYNVVTATNGKEGIALAKDRIPDIIISDIVMPMIDGYTLTKTIKQDPITSHIPIILLTAKNKEVDQIEAIGLGADAYTTKPFSPKLLKATVANLIKNRRKLQERFTQELILTPKEIAVTNAEEEFLNRLQEVLETNLTQPDFTTAKFSEVMLMNRMQLHRKLKALTGLSSSEFIKNQRLKIAAQLITSKDLHISEVAYSTGFNDPSYFAKCFKQEYGVTPKEFAQKNKE